MMVCCLNNALGAYSENYSDSAAGRCQKLQTVGRHQPVPPQMSTMMKISAQSTTRKILEQMSTGMRKILDQAIFTEISRDLSTEQIPISQNRTQNMQAVLNTPALNCFFFCWGIFGRFLLARVPDGGARIFQQVLNWIHYECTNITNKYVCSNMFLQIWVKCTARGTRQCQLGGSWWSPGEAEKATSSE